MKTFSFQLNKWAKEHKNVEQKVLLIQPWDLCKKSCNKECTNKSLLKAQTDPNLVY